MYKPLKKIYILSIIIVVMSQLSLVYYFEYGLLKKQIEKDLYRAAKDIKYILPDNYINKNLNKNSYTRETILKNTLLLKEKALEKGVDYLWVMIRDREDIVYVVMSGDEKETLDLKNYGFWYSLKEAEDDSLSQTLQIIDSNESVYIRSSDIWGEYMSIYIPEVSEDGTIYIAGADIEIKNFRKSIFLSSLRLLLPFGLIMLIVTLSFIKIRKVNHEKKCLEDHIENTSKLDATTGALTREYGLEILKKMIENKIKNKSHLSVYLIEIQKFESISSKNQSYDREKLLKVLKNLISGTFRKGDPIIRYDENSFMIILDNYTRIIERDFSKLEKRIDYFNKNNEMNLFIDTNSELLEYSNESMDIFLKKLKNLLRLIKLNNKKKTINQIKIYNGIKNNEFKTYYQPKIDLFNKTVSFEALVRWITPDGNIISPLDFISIAEKSFLINEITEVVLKDSLELIKNLDVDVSINISTISFESDTYMDKLKRNLKESKYSKHLTLEITESLAIKNIDKSLNKINDLKTTGVLFSIDDFGTGYSSLNSLFKLPIDEVKVDKTFVDNICTSASNKILIEFINKLSFESKFSVVYEGVETVEQIEELINLGSYKFQGYYFGKPEPLEVVTKNIKDRSYFKKIEPLKR